ncbi:hypothetical protein TELCIR_07307 [Teladorsagia circumcincta]|uniref:Phospholipid scramblase n=1 Tax=Teladorsagia circumcincta TaxID=45464 RepID=A0A2G9UKN2_TELCI|nr:hypothetical protein TELCIR_07307 [Teladorsagia circumcincta]
MVITTQPGADDGGKHSAERETKNGADSAAENRENDIENEQEHLKTNETQNMMTGETQNLKTDETQKAETGETRKMKTDETQKPKTGGMQNGKKNGTRDMKTDETQKDKEKIKRRSPEKGQRQGTPIGTVTSTSPDEVVPELQALVSLEGVLVEQTNETQNMMTGETQNLKTDETQKAETGETRKMKTDESQKPKTGGMQNGKKNGTRDMKTDETQKDKEKIKRRSPEKGQRQGTPIGTVTSTSPDEVIPELQALVSLEGVLVEQLFHIAEKSNCCGRNFNKRWRGFQMVMADFTGKVFAKLKRPCRCLYRSNLCASCYFFSDVIIAESPPGNRLFHIAEKSNCCGRNFNKRWRGFQMVMADFTGKVFAKLKRPCRCLYRSNLCASCYFFSDVIIAESPPGNRKHKLAGLSYSLESFILPNYRIKTFLSQWFVDFLLVYYTVIRVQNGKNNIKTPVAYNIYQIYHAVNIAQKKEKQEL